MKKQNYVVTLLMGGLITLGTFSCDDNKDEKSAIKPGADDKISEVYAGYRESLKQTFTLNAAAGGEVIGKEGTTVTFYPNTFLNAKGEVVTGNVSIELIEIYKKSDMLLTNMTTQGIDAAGNISTLISAGEFFVNAKQGSDPLTAQGNFQIMAPADKTGGIDQAMKPFQGVEECNNGVCKNVWKQENRDMKIGESAYSIFKNQFGWTNIDRWSSDPRPKTTLFVDVPTGYDNTNCSVYLSYDGEPTALASFDRYDATTALFTEHYGQIPIGLEVHFILVSVIDEQWYYSIKAATIGANHVETFTELQPVTEAELTTLINNLP